MTSMKFVAPSRGSVAHLTRKLPIVAAPPSSRDCVWAAQHLLDAEIACPQARVEKTLRAWS